MAQAYSCFKELIELYHPPRALCFEDSGLLVTHQISKIRSQGRSFSLETSSALGEGEDTVSLYWSILKTFLFLKAYSSIPSTVG